MDCRTLDRTGRSTSVRIVVVSDVPSDSQRDDDDAGSVYMVCTTDPRTSRWVVRSNDYGNDRGLVRCMSGFLTGRTWVIEVIEVCGGPPGFYPCEVCGDGGYLDFLTG